MTDANSNLPQPTRRARTVLTQISTRAWEHPADRAALNAMRAIPGFDELVRKIYGFFGERGVRLLFQANAVRVGPTQFPKLNGLFNDVCGVMDWDRKPELFVTQTPFVNAGAYGMDKPFIVINSATLGLLDDDEMTAILGHELGHVMSGHVLYTTIMTLLLFFGIRNLPFLAGIAILPIQLAMLEWFRKAEFSCDRAALLASQDPVACMRKFMKMSGGGNIDQMDLNAFMVQAREYEQGGDGMDMIMKVLNTLGHTHPFHTVRAAELQRWVEGGDYDRILRGEYPRRGSDDDKRPVSEDFADAGKYYGDQMKDTLDAVSDVARKAREAFSSAFAGKGPSKG